MNSKLPWNKSGNGIECADRYRVGSVNSIGTREGIANMDLIVAAVNEHAALVAVAEAAEMFKAVGQYWLNYPLGIPMSAWSVDDRTRYVTAEKMLNKALANLAAVRATSGETKCPKCGQTGHGAFACNKY